MNKIAESRTERFEAANADFRTALVYFSLAFTHIFRAARHLLSGIALSLVFLFLSAPIYADTDFIVVYSSGLSVAARFRTLSERATFWGATGSGTDMAATIQNVAVKACPNRDEAIMGVLNNAGDIYISTWSSASGWAQTPRLIEDSITATNDNFRGFDIAYEQTSGDALVVWQDNTADKLCYMTFDGTNWSAEQSTATLPTGDALVPVWVQMASKPGSNEISLIYSAGSGANEAGALIWDGSGWVSQKLLGIYVPNDNEESVAVEYMNASERAMFCYSSGTAVQSITWDTSGGWGSEVYIGDFGDNIAFIKLAANTTDQLMLAVTDLGNDISTVRYTGSVWVEQTQHDGGARAISNHYFDLKWETISGHETHCLLVYSDSADVDYGVWDGSAWTITSGLWAEEANNVVMSEKNGVIWVVFFENLNKDIYARRWDESAGSWDSETYLLETEGVYNTNAKSIWIAPVTYSSSAGDSIPPAAISNLTALGGLHNRMTLKWTAPGDDGTGGGNVDYFTVKYSSNYISADDWSASWVTTWGNISTSTAYGAEELHTITGLFSEGATYWFAVKAYDGTNWGVWPGTTAVINKDSFCLPTSSAPAAITTLSALTGSSSGEVDLTWTAPGDDGTTGAITDGKFVIRYATYTNVDWNTASAEWTDFDEKYELVIDTDTNNYNEVHSRTMTGLRSGVEYYFRLKTADEQPNWSALSNHATAQAYSAPPSAPSALAQYDSVWNAISWGDWINYQQIRATFTLSHPEGNDMQFNIQFSTYANFSYSYVNSTNPATATLAQGATNYLSPLLPEGTWYWRVMATDAGGLSSAYASSDTANSYHLRIDTTSPTGLANTSPLNNSTELENSTTLVCAVATDALSGGVEYYFEIDTTTAFNGSGKQSSGWQAGASYSPSLSYGTTYYWRVKAKDAAGNETSYTAEWKFLVEDVPLYSISGAILDGLSQPLVAVTVILSSGACVETTTNGSGYYEFTGLVSSDYVVTPSSATRYFSPANLTYGSLSADQINQNFTGTECYGNQFMVVEPLSAGNMTSTDYKTAIRFKARTSQNVSNIKVRQHTESGASPSYRYGIQGDADGVPSGTWLGATNSAYGDGKYATAAWVSMNLGEAALLSADSIYYIVVFATADANASDYIALRKTTPRNFKYPLNGSPNTDNLVLFYNGSQWIEDAAANAVYVIDAATPEGNPYYAATTASAGFSVTGSTWVGNEFVVRGSTIGVNKISFYIRKYGAPEDSLYYELRGPDSFDTVIEAGTFSTEAGIGTSYAWVSKTLDATRDLAKDSKYWIMLRSPSTTGQTSAYNTYLLGIDATGSSTNVYNDLSYGGQSDCLLARYWSDAETVSSSNQHDVAFRFDVVDALGDIYPPAAISNLTALAGAYGGEIQLKWSAPGDNGMLGDNSAGSYLVKYATQYISSANFDANWVSTYTQSWTPSSTPGSEELKILTGFTEGVTYWFVMKTSDDEGNWSVWNSSGGYAAVNSSNSVAATREAPSAITNLSAFLESALGSGEVKLSWTAPGDDGTKAGDSGGPSSYIIRFSTNSIGDGDWDASWVSSYSTAPASIGNYGETEIMTLTQMAEAATYYFRIKSVDDAGNVSAIDTTAVKAFCDMRPDLLITETDIQSSDYFPEAMDIIFITATVRNIGSAYRAGDSTWTSVQFYSGQPPAPWGDGSGTLFAYYHANSSPSYNQSFEAYSGAWQIPEGSHQIYVVVDSSETITERSESNNTSYISIEAPPIPPAAISNLTAFLNGASEGQIKLRWTAPGDDGMGKADCAGYLVKYADKYIGSDDFYASWVSTYAQTWTPAAFGTEENRTLEGFTPGVTYWFAIKAYDTVPNYGVWTSSGESAAVNTLNSSYAQWDVLSPAAVSNLTALAGSLDGEARLVWTAPGDDGWSGDLAGGLLKILASTYSITTANFDSITENPYYTHLRAMTTSYSTQGTEHSYTMTGLYAGTTYYFALKAADDAGNWSFWSYSGVNTKSTAPAQDLPPEIISNFTATAGQEKITLAWTEPALPDLDFYRFYRSSTAPYDFSDAYTFDVSAGNSSYEDTGLEVGIEYRYRAETFDLGDGTDGLYSVVLSSAYSAVASATPLPPPDSGAMVVYYSTPTALQNTPLYRTLEKGTTEWSAQAQSNDVGASVQYWHILKNSPVTNEKILVTLDSAQDVNVQKWSGSSWAAATELTANAGVFTTRVVDGEYEHSSGDFLIVYRNGANAAPVYRTLAKGSGSWSVEANVPYYGLSGVPKWIRLESRLGTDEIMLVASDDAKDLFAILWDGSQWLQASSTTLTTALSDSLENHLNQCWDVVCEYQSGNFFVAYGTGTSYTVAYKRFLSASSSWEDENYMLTATNNVNWVKLASEKREGSNYILAGAVDDGLKLGMIVWNGSVLGNAVTTPNNVKTDGSRAFDLAWESGRTAKGLVAYSRGVIDDSPKYRTVDGTTVSGSESDSLDIAARGDDPYVVRLVPDPYSDNIWMAYSTYGATPTICALRWKGVANGTWDGGKIICSTTTTAATYENFSIVYGTFAASDAIAPDAPSNLAQYLEDWTALSWGDWTTERIIRSSFTLSDSDSSNLKYQIQFSTYSNFSFSYIDSIQPSSGYLPVGATNFITTLETALLPEGTWFWRVKAIDDDGQESAYSSATVVNGLHFGVDVSTPTGLANASPLDNSTELSLSTTLVSAVASDTLSGGVSYSFQLSTTSAFNGADDQNSGWQAGTSYSPSLSYNSTYYWRVKAKDSAGNETDWTAAWTFETLNVTLYSISGYIKDGDANALEGITVVLSSGAYSRTTTNAAGYYEFTGLISSDYVVTPSSATRYFAPVNYTYGALSENKSSQNFTGTESYGNQFMIDTTEAAGNMTAVSHKTAIRFKAKTTQNVSGFYVSLNSEIGTSPSYRYGIQADDNGVPSGTWLGGGAAYADAQRNVTGWTAKITLEAALTAGEIYHIVVEPLDASPPDGSNYIAIRKSSPANFKYPYDGAPAPSDLVLFYNGSEWIKYPNSSGIYAIDGTVQEGNSYAALTVPTQESESQYRVSGDTWTGVQFTVRGSTRTVSKLHFYMKKVGAPAGDAAYEIRGPDNFSTFITSGTFVEIANAPTSYGWVSRELSPKVTFAKDRRYWALLKSEGSAGTWNNDLYQLNINYAQSLVAIFKGLTYGGAADDQYAYSRDGGTSVLLSDQRDGVFRFDVAEYDTTAPAAVTTLSASTHTLTGQVALSWEAPGDDGWTGALGTSGDQARFGIKCATYTAFNWGSPENFDVSIDTYGVNPYDIQTQLISLARETTYYFRIWTRDELSAGNWSELSSGATVWARIAPSAITTLSALANDEGDVHLSWIAPGDDGTTVTITGGQWKIRYSTISTVDWTESSGWTDEKNKYEILIDTTCEPLSEHSRGITDLSLRGGVTYYFRIWTRDEATGANAPGNWSEISNGSTATVVRILGVSVSTDTYNFGEVDLSASSTSASGITVTNTGNTEQDYSLVISSITLYDNSPSVWKSTDTSPGHDRFLLYAIFHGAPAESSYFVNKDTVTAVSATSSDEIFTYDGGATGNEETGAGVPAAGERTLWLKIDMPTTVNTSKTQKIKLRISAGASP